MSQLDAFTSRLDFGLDPFQRRACEALEAGHGVLVCAPTGAGKTIVGEFADTLVFCSIAATALGISTWGDFVNYTIVGFVWKTLVEIVIMPVTYFVVGWLKRAEPTYQEALDAATARTTDVP